MALCQATVGYMTLRYREQAHSYRGSWIGSYVDLRQYLLMRAAVFWCGWKQPCCAHVTGLKAKVAP